MSIPFTRQKMFRRETKYADTPCIWVDSQNLKQAEAIQAAVSLIFQESRRGEWRAQKSYNYKWYFLSPAETRSQANDDVRATVSASLTSSLHGLSKLLDICLRVEISRLSHCPTVSNLYVNDIVTTFSEKKALLVYCGKNKRDNVFPSGHVFTLEKYEFA